MSDQETLWRATELAIGYGRHTVLRDVNLVIREGEFWFFLGPNGQGKTTLLRCILGMLKPRSGELWRDPLAMGYERLGFVPQRCDLNPTLPTTVQEFVRMGLVGIKCSAGDERERLAWALEKVGLGGKERVSYWALSGGQRQRALVARALIRQPRLLILDEPTNGLDLTTEEALLGFLAELNASDRLTMVFVTHDLALAARYGSHFALFGGGTVVAGPGESVLREAELTRAYGLPLDIDRNAEGVATVRLRAGRGMA